MGALRGRAIASLSRATEVPLRNLPSRRALQDLGKRNEKMEQAVQRYGYTEREVADHLRMYFTSVDRIMRETKRMLRK